MRLARRIPIPVCLAAILLAVLLLVLDAMAAAWYFAAFIREAQPITVPATVELDVGADRPDQILWREYHGSHITANRPLLPVPDDLALTITDRQSGQTIPTTPARYSQRLRILNIGAARQGIASFTPPAHGQITVSVAGGFAHEQVYSVGPTPTEWNSYAGNGLLIVALIALAMLIAALALLAARALATPPADQFSLD